MLCYTVQRICTLACNISNTLSHAHLNYKHVRSWPLECAILLVYEHAQTLTCDNCVCPEDSTEPPMTICRDNLYALMLRSADTYQSGRWEMTDNYILCTASRRRRHADDPSIAYICVGVGFRYIVPMCVSRGHNKSSSYVCRPRTNPRRPRVAH